MSQRQRNRRAGFSYRVMLVVLGVLAVCGAVAWLLVAEVDWAPAASGPLMHEVKRGDFLHEINERGEVESASNVEIRCEVKARGMGVITILWLVAEGTYVQPGEVLVKLDSSGLENELNQQKIVCSTSEANVVTAQNDLDAAKIAKREYLEGLYVLNRKLIDDKKFVAEQAKVQAKHALEYSTGLLKKGYVTKWRVETDEIAVKKAENELRSAELELETLDKYTKEKMLKQLDSAINITEGRLSSAMATHKLDEEQRKLIEDQIAKCVIRATEAGQVVYANEYRRHGGQDIVIEEGTTVREQQVIIRLPDPKRMQVTARINEAKIAMVGEGMPAKIRLDAFSDLELDGVVERVNEYPAPSSFWAANVKEYETAVRILGSPEELKPGLTAEVRIQVELLPDALQVPVQAVFEHGGKQYCVMRGNESWRAQEVKIGSSNDKFIVIREGLKEGDEIVLGAFEYREKVKLPKLADQGKIRRRAPGPARPEKADPQPPAAPSTAPAGAAPQGSTQPGRPSGGAGP